MLPNIRILVCGGRDYINERRVFQVLSEYKDCAIVIIHGRAEKGADLIAQDWAIINRIPDMPFPVPKCEWQRFGKAAGPKRNTRMLLEGHPDLVIAFPGGRGTADMVRQARKANVEVREIEDIPV